jgi:hypothetical protein
MRIEVTGRVELEILRRLSVADKRSPESVLESLLREKWEATGQPPVEPGPVGAEAYFESVPGYRMTAKEAVDHYVASGGMPVTNRELRRQLRELGAIKNGMRIGSRVVGGWTSLRRRLA